jgi:hypothetical protein
VATHLGWYIRLIEQLLPTTFLTKGQIWQSRRRLLLHTILEGTRDNLRAVAANILKKDGTTREIKAKKEITVSDSHLTLMKVSKIPRRYWAVHIALPLSFCDSASGLRQNLLLTELIAKLI